MFNEHLNIKEQADVTVERVPTSICDGLRPKGRFQVEHYDRHGILLATYDISNAITDVGMNALLDVKFNSGSQVTVWYIGLIDNASYSALSNSDTTASHAGWLESTAYSNSTRITWGSGAASARSVTNGSTSDFTINATATIKGIFIVSNSTKGGSTGELWSTAAFGTNVSINSGDTLKVTYTVSG
jgi:hypothetical protein